MSKPRVYLDTSAMFSGIWSETGGSRQIFRLAEAGAIEVFTGEFVLSELESVLEEKAPESLGDLTLLLDRIEVEILGQPASAMIEELNQKVNSRPDAIVLATAVSGDVDWFITYDRSEFLDNQNLQQNIELTIGTAGDFLTHFKETLD